MKLIKNILLLSSSIFLCACVNNIHNNPTQHADQLAAKGSMHKKWVQTHDFKFLTYEKIASNNFDSDKNNNAANNNFKLANKNFESGNNIQDENIKDLHLYIEGDGRSYITPSRVSPDPTPHHPLALQLALQDPHPNIVYLARPCQYSMQDQNLIQEKACKPAVWTSHRFTESIIASINEAITAIKKETRTKHIHLIGFSGGAAVATLIAARRSDIVSLRTVAGDLNHERMSEYHDTTPLASNSLNPIQVVEKLANLPQHHFAGADDKTVPPFISEEFVKQAARIRSHCVRRTVLTKVSHHAGWEVSWPQLLKAEIGCEKR